MLTPTEAAQTILQHVTPLPTERRALKEALDLVLAEDVRSPIDLPGWDNSAMDGYAVRASDLAGAASDRTATLTVIETVAAGRFPAKPVGPGQATRIFTGAPLPAGADSVIRQEDVELLHDGRVTVRDGRDAGKNIRRRGEDIRKGDVALAAGATLGPAQLGVLASIAHGTPLVHRPPRVAFMGSGDEIADVDEAEAILAGRKIATSNSYTLFGMIHRAGGVPLDLGVARDTKASLRDHLTLAGDADVLVTTAGVSVGEHDLVRDVLTELGCDMKLWRIRMRPGAPLGFGLLAGKPWLGLPGNPVSTMVTFELFVRPVLRRLLGHPLPFRRTVPVCVGEPITLGPRLRHFLRAVVNPEGAGGSLVARLTGPQGSGILSSMARANALLIVPEDRPSVAAGETLQALVLDDPHHVAEVPFSVGLTPELRRGLRLAAVLALTALIYWVNLHTPAAFRFGILYVLPVLLAAWHDGLAWGIVFAGATSVLRYLVGIDQMPADTPLEARLSNELSYLAVVAVAIAGLSQLRRTQAQLELLATHDPLTNVLNARAFSTELAQELSRNRRYGRPLALIYLDLDDLRE